MYASSLVMSPEAQACGASMLVNYILYIYIYIYIYIIFFCSYFSLLLVLPFCAGFLKTARTLKISFIHTSIDPSPLMRHPPFHPSTHASIHCHRSIYPPFGLGEPSTMLRMYSRASGVARPGFQVSGHRNLSCYRCLTGCLNLNVCLARCCLEKSSRALSMRTWNVSGWATTMCV